MKTPSTIATLPIKVELTFPYKILCSCRNC